MEIYRNSSNPRVTIQAPETVVPLDDTIDIKAVDSKGTVLHVFDQVLRVAEGFAVRLPWSLTRQDSEFFIDWKFDYLESGQTTHVEEHTQVNIVTPILNLDEVKKLSGFTDDYEVCDLERRLRYAIQTYTATSFGKFYGTIPVSGTGDSKLNLPLPLLRVDSPKNLSIFGAGLYLGVQNVTYYPGGIKSAPPEEVLDQFFISAGPIRAPMAYPKVWFNDNVQYQVTGVWGYNDVPEDVRQAARLLAADYACDESLWRDRYITVMKSGDWSIEFAGGAFTGTGNVAADQILASYRRTNLVII
jgi:hypothetical protein